MLVRIVGRGAAFVLSGGSLSLSICGFAPGVRLFQFGLFKVAGFELFGGFLFDQRFAIGDRKLIIIRMNFIEGKKTVAITAIFNKSRL